MLKKIFPSTLLARFILIILLPAIISQSLIIYLFYKRHWYNVSQYNARFLTSEIEHVYNNYAGAGDCEAQKFLSIRFQTLSQDFAKLKQRKIPRELTILKEHIDARISPRNIVYADKENNLHIKLAREGGKVLNIKIHKKYMLSPTTYIFVLWVVALNFVLLLIAILFLRGQINSVVELSKIAGRLSNSLVDIKNYRPSGAREVRLAGLAILKMKSRLSKKILRRTQMLAMISHDLRTPLTRMKLQLELMEEGSEKEGLKKDVEDMEQIIYPLLDLARAEGSAGGGDARLMHAWLKSYVESSPARDGFELSLARAAKNVKGLRALINARILKRAMDNVISNSMKFAERAVISIYKSDDNICICAEDNGPGINDKDKELIFTPFYQSEESSKGTGLGLSIVREIVAGHGGNVLARDSKKLGGLKIEIFLPVYEGEK